MSCGPHIVRSLICLNGCGCSDLGYRKGPLSEVHSVMHFHSQNTPVCPLPSSLPHPPSQAWGHPTAPMLLTSNSKDSSLHLCTFYRNGVIQYELFCRWLLLLNFMSLEVMHTSSMAAYIHPLVVVHYVTIAWSICCAAHGHLGNSHMGILSYYGIAVTDIIVPGMSTYFWLPVEG